MAAKHNVIRSISLLSRSHPTTIRVEEELSKLQASSSCASTSNSICKSLCGLEELYECVDDLLQMASTQQLLSQHQQQKCMDDLLDGSVKLLDICGITRDTISTIKEHVRALQSALRRRKGDSSRESAVIRVLREVCVENMSIFQSLLVFLAVPVSKPKANKWSLVSKFMHKGVIACEDQNEDIIGHELDGVDTALYSLSKSSSTDVQKVQSAQKRLEALEIIIEGLENGLDSVFRRLIKTRASLLNIISQ